VDPYTSRVEAMTLGRADRSQLAAQTLPSLDRPAMLWLAVELQLVTARVMLACLPVVLATGLVVLSSFVQGTVLPGVAVMSVSRPAQEAPTAAR